MVDPLERRTTRMKGIGMNTKLGDEPPEVQSELLKMAAMYSIPIFWGTKETSQVDNNGTAFILDTGERRFVVTAAHVYESYLKKKSKGLIDDCQLSNLPFELEEKRISTSSSSSMDIATFDITEQEIQSLKRSVLQGNQRTWPPKRPRINEAIVIAGFPGNERQQVSTHGYSFGLYCFNTPVSSISNRHFGCVLEREYWVDSFQLGLPEEGYDLGGISGAPALALDLSSSGIVSWRLAGVVYNSFVELGEIFLVHHAEFIKSDGTVIQST